MLRWKVEEPRYNTFEGAVGVQGAAGAVGLARLDLGNVLGTARAVSLAWQSRGRGLTDFGARYAEPLAFGTPLRLELALQQQVQDTVYTRFRWGAKARALIGTRETVEGGFEKERVVQTTGALSSADLASVTFAIERDARDDALSPRRGPDPVALARRVLERWYAAAVYLRVTRPIRRRAAAWLGLR